MHDAGSPNDETFSAKARYASLMLKNISSCTAYITQNFTNFVIKTIIFDSLFMRTRFPIFSLLLILSVFLMTLTSCSSSAKLVVSNGANISKYKYVSFGKEQTGDRELDDVMLLVQNEIANTKLQPISLTYAPDDYLGYTLTPHINVKSEKWDGGHTYITITFYDLYTDQSVAVVKSSGIGLSISQDQKLALGAIRKKLQTIFGKKE